MARLCGTATDEKKWYAMMGVKERTAQWVEEFIIAMNICPFAKKPWMKNAVRIRVVEEEQEEALTQALLEELLALSEQPADELETTLLVHPAVLSDFDEFLAYVEWTNEVLEKSGLEGVIQIVGFHPDYYFEGAEQDKANYTNRSPYQMLHLIREQSVEEAALSYPNIEGIPERNIELLRKMELADLQKIAALRWE